MEQDSVFIKHQKQLQRFLDDRAEKLSHWKGWGGFYRKRIGFIYQFLIPPGMRVLEVGSGRGDLIAAVKPRYGVGTDVSAKMVAVARKRHPKIHFLQADVHTLDLQETFDYIILSDLVNDLWDVQTALSGLGRLCHAHTRIILNLYSQVWQPVLSLARKLRLANTLLEQNWLTVEDTQNLLNLAGFEFIRHWPEVLLPLPIPLLRGFCNRFLVRFWPFNQMALSNFIIARPASLPQSKVPNPTVSVIVPARNESGNIRSIFERVPKMGKQTEIIFVEGHSKDDTFAAIQREMKAHKNVNSRLFQQTGIGKADAVRKGFVEARGEVLDDPGCRPDRRRPKTCRAFIEAIVTRQGRIH